MAGEILGEVLIGLGTWGTQLGMNRVRRWRDEAYFEALSDGEKAVFLEIVIAAILEDGVRSELESQWLERRAEAGAARELIDAALATVREALPDGSSTDDVVELVAGRAAQLGSDESRERAFTNAARILLASNREGARDVAALFGRGMGLDPKKADAIVGQLHLGQL
jgi:hypothetical protein